MARIRRGGGRLRAGGGRTRNDDCCCNEPIPCATINDEPTRATWEISYEIFGLSVGSQTCGGLCNSEAPFSAVLPYVGGGFAEDWAQTVSICGDWYYFASGGIRCTAGMVDLSLTFGVANVGVSRWGITWGATVPEASFILGDTFTLPRISSLPASSSVCLPLPSNGVGTTCDFTVSLA